MTNYFAGMDTSAVVHQIALGEISLTVDSFTLDEEQPYQLTKMWNGAWYLSPLGRKPCVLALECRVLAAEQAALLPALRSAFKNRTVFAFQLANTAFSDMRLSAFRVKSEEGARFCRVSLSLYGSAEDITA